MGLGVRFVIRTSNKQGVANTGISLGVMLGVYTAGVSISIPSPDHPMGRITNREQVSGAHLNPAVTFANWSVPIRSLETCKQTEEKMAVCIASFRGRNGRDMQLPKSSAQCAPQPSSTVRLSLLSLPLLFLFTHPPRRKLQIRNRRLRRRTRHPNRPWLLQPQHGRNLLHLPRLLHDAHRAILLRVHRINHPNVPYLCAAG